MSSLSTLRSRLARGVVLSLALVMALTAAAADREGELEGLREKIEKSRERVTGHEASERAILEQLEQADQRLNAVTRERDKARRDVGDARARLAGVEPRLEQAKSELARTQRALAARAVALYRGGEIGAVRVRKGQFRTAELVANAAAAAKHGAKAANAGLFVSQRPEALADTA